MDRAIAIPILIPIRLVPSKDRIKDRLNFRNGHLNIPQPSTGTTQVHKLIEPVRILRPGRRSNSTRLKRRLLTPPFLCIRGMIRLGRPDWCCWYSLALAVLAIARASASAGDVGAGGFFVFGGAIGAGILAVTANSQCATWLGRLLVLRTS